MELKIIIFFNMYKIFKISTKTFAKNSVYNINTEIKKKSCD